jgi:hypothetical protein
MALQALHVADTSLAQAGTLLACWSDLVVEGQAIALQRATMQGTIALLQQRLRKGAPYQDSADG